MNLLIHREGRATLLLAAVVFGGILLALDQWFPPALWVGVPLAIGAYFFLLYFFRAPNRPLPEEDPRLIYAPADGKVVVIEETTETEVFGERRLQVSIFMSPLNVHSNRNPVSGKVAYYRYHPGKYLVAWHPKSSTENERTTIVLDTGQERVLFRQIAGAMARRIVAYLKEGQEVRQGAEMGFIKFGSRVDLLLPTDCRVQVGIGESVRSGQTVIAVLPD